MQTIPKSFACDPCFEAGGITWQRIALCTAVVEQPSNTSSRQHSSDAQNKRVATDIRSSSGRDLKQLDPEVRDKYNKGVCEECYELGKVIGKGGFATVRHGVRPRSCPLSFVLCKQVLSCCRDDDAVAVSLTQTVSLSPPSCQMPTARTRAR